MGRSDHSMRPPTPATTIAFHSPNACNLCHADHDAAWADQWVRKWYLGKVARASSCPGHAPPHRRLTVAIADRSLRRALSEHHTGIA
jgi:hypothetical protein